jgi:hypothetical protein
VLDKIKRSWSELAQATAGKRFEERYEQMRGRGTPASRALKAAAAVALIIAGLAMLFVPGPGSLAILAGGALIAEQSLTVARLLDRTEVGIRKIHASAVLAWRRFRSRRQ